MSYNYGRLQSMAEGLIKKFGRPLEFSRVERGEYIPSQSRTVNNVSLVYTGNCVQSAWTLAEKTQGDILETDLKLVAEVADYKKEDYATIDGQQYQIYALSKVQPASDKLLYILQMRK